MSVEKAAKLFRSITEIDDDLIADAAAGRNRQTPWRKWCAAAACAALAAVSVFHMMPREKTTAFIYCEEQNTGSYPHCR